MNRLIVTTIFIFVVFIHTTATTVLANGTTLSITPTLYEMSAEPGQEWSSSIRVSNSNSFDLTIYPSVTNFAPEGESGQGSFIPIEETESQGTTLAEWISIDAGPITIPEEQVVDIPITVRIPQDAIPGGHFAAIMISTRPPEVAPGSLPTVSTSQVVTSLFFASVAGDIIESGIIRSFRTLSSVVNTPETTFELRFENTGNVHVQPQGEIIVKNMWGRERGSIPINKQTHFGNVLPESIRKFEFGWKAPFSLADIGRYRAEVALAYGSKNRQFVDQTAYFWVVPWQGLLVTVGSLLFIFFLVRYMIKSYIRRMLILAGVDPDLGRKGVRVTAPRLQGADIKIQKRAPLSSPLTNAFKEFHTKVSTVSALKDKAYAILLFLKTYYLAVLCIVCVSIALVGLWKYVQIVTNDESLYEITIIGEGGSTDTTISSEQIIYDQQDKTDHSNETSNQDGEVEQPYYLILTNASGRAGVAADLRMNLEEKQYVVGEINSDLSSVNERTVILYHPELETEALALSRDINNVLISATELDSIEEETPVLKVIIGKDYLQE